MKKRILLVLMCLSVFVLGACAVGIVSCGSENPDENEQDTEIGKMESVVPEENIDGTENMEGPAADGEEPEGLPTPEVSTFGITLTAEDVTPTGLTIVCAQSGGSSTGELHTGSYYVLEKSEAGEWVTVDYARPELEVGWTVEAWIIPMNDTVEWEVDWEWLYGSLPAGHYRIGKEVMDFRGAGDYDKAYYYAEFEIE